MKTLIINRVKGKNNSIYVPTTDVNAATFATDFLDGEWQVLSNDVANVGSDSVSSANDVSIMVKAVDGSKLYFNMLTPISKTEEQIFTALKGLTLNGVLVDTAYILGMKLITY